MNEEQKQSLGTTEKEENQEQQKNKNKDKNKDKGLNSIIGEVLEENQKNEEEIEINDEIQDLFNEMKTVQRNEKLPLKTRILLKLGKIKRKLPIIGKSPNFIAYIIQPRGSKRVKVYKSENNQFFEHDNTQYFINRTNLISMKYESEPVLIYKENVSEPIDPTSDNENITFSNDISTAVEGTIIDQFNRADLNIEYLEKVLKLNLMIGAGSLIAIVIIIVSLMQNGMFIGGWNNEWLYRRRKRFKEI